MKCNLSKLFKRDKKGKVRMSWRYYLAVFLGSVEGKED